MLPAGAPDDDPDIISKSEFARRRNVKPPRVTQWIKANQIFGTAIVGEGRGARIRESIACEQLNRTLNISQRLGNGIGTRLAHSERPQVSTDQRVDRAVPSESAELDLPSPVAPRVLTTQDLIAEERLAQLKRQNERDRVDDAVRRGRLVDAGAAKAASARETTQIMTLIESRLGDAATAIAAEFKLIQRDVLHLIRREFIKIRGEVADEIRAKAGTMAERVGFEFAGERAAEQMEA